jgi:hypothetical protein
MRKELGMINAVLVLACLTIVGIFCKPKMILHLIPLKPIKPAVEIILVMVATATSPTTILSLLADVLIVTQLLLLCGETVQEALRYLSILCPIRYN